MTRRPLLLLATSSLFALAACGFPDATSGELNNGRFSYLCVDSSDTTCDGLIGNSSLPELIAVGGAFDLEYAGDSAGSSPVQVQPASETMISGASGHLKFLLPGIGAVVARNTSGVVADFVHLRGASIDHLDVAGPASSDFVTEVEMTSDDDVILQVAAKDNGGSPLSGALPYVWTSSNDKIVTLGEFGPKNRATLKGVAPGTATVEVTLPGGLKRSVVVTVKQGKGSSSSSGEGGAGGGGGGGATGAGGAGGGK
jgi:hypothetical protein